MTTLNEPIYYAEKNIFEIIETDFEFVETKSWYKLYQNKNDKSYWRLDIWDKYQTQFFVKLNSIENWEQFDAEKSQIDLLRKARGISQEKCNWSNCANKSLNNIAFCEFHAYKEMGMRK